MSNGSRSPRQDRALALAIGGVVVAGVGAVAALVLVAWLLKVAGVDSPEVVLPILLVSSVVLLVVVFAALASLFKHLALAETKQALGLPRGSVRAIIALIFILIFAVVGLYLAGAFLSPDTEIAELQGVTELQLAAIPVEDIRAQTPVAGSDPQTFNVERAIPTSPEASQFATQLLTVISTLVAAVAAFYLGSRSVEEGSKAAVRAAGLAARGPDELTVETLGVDGDPGADSAFLLGSVSPFLAGTRWCFRCRQAGTDDLAYVATPLREMIEGDHPREELQGLQAGTRYEFYMSCVGPDGRRYSGGPLSFETLSATPDDTTGEEDTTAEEDTT